MICILSGHEHHAAIHRKACIVQYPSRTYLLIVLSKNFVSNVCHFTLRSRVDHGWLPRTQRWATLTPLSIKLPVVSSHNIFIDVVNAGLNHEFHAVFVIICHVYFLSIYTWYDFDTNGKLLAEETIVSSLCTKIINSK